MKVPSHNIELNDRVLWHDGYSTVSEEYIENALARGESTEGLCVEVLTPTIQQYNSMVDPDQWVTVKTEVGEPNKSFTIPEKYQNLDVSKYVLDKLTLELERGRFPGKLHTYRTIRTEQELLLYENLGLLDVLRTLIYIINTLQDKNIVWGVGRGSSVASYVLYLIGVHDVDSVEYGLDVGAFLRS